MVQHHRKIISRSLSSHSRSAQPTAFSALNSDPPALHGSNLRRVNHSSRNHPGKDSTFCEPGLAGNKQYHFQYFCPSQQRGGCELVQVEQTSVGIRNYEANRSSTRSARLNLCQTLATKAHELLGTIDTDSTIREVLESAPPICCDADKSDADA